jgi:hydrogenase nickel incorporation protein HypB
LKTWATSFARPNSIPAPPSTLVILSIPEGDDKPLKYPLMFKVAHGGGLQQDGYLSVFDFDLPKPRTISAKLNPNASISRSAPKRAMGWMR